MNPSHQRKIAYLLSMVAAFTLLLLVSKYLIEPAAASHNLAQKSLGKVNPISGTAQLVFMGFRGVAVTFLWAQANDLQKKERYFEIRPVVESITLLQPNFVRPWYFQAWNMAYNIAAEWEAVKDKYYWIRQGIDYLKEASENNRNVTDLEWYVGWYYFNRFGMSDDKIYLRDMLRKEEDETFASPAAQLPRDMDLDAVTNERDNFQLAYVWFSRANDTIVRTKKRPRQMGITPFMSDAPKSKMAYAEFRATDGLFGPGTLDAWRRAHDKWVEFGRMGEPGREAFIHKLEYTAEEWDGQRICDFDATYDKELDAGGVPKGLIDELSRRGRTISAAAVNKVEEAGIEWRINDGDQSFAIRREGKKFAAYSGGLTRELKFWAQHYGNIVNYPYWKQRANVEATKEMQQAREGFYLARQASQQADYEKAVEEFEKAFPIWRDLVKKDDVLRTDTVDILRESQENEERYLRLKRRLDQPIPAHLQPRPMDGLFPSGERPMPMPGPPSPDMAKPSEPKPDQPPDKASPAPATKK